MALAINSTSADSVFGYEYVSDIGLSRLDFARASEGLAPTNADDKKQRGIR